MVFPGRHPVGKWFTCTIFVILIMLPALSDAQNIKILILDGSYRDIPDLADMRRVGNISGRLLFKGVEYRGRIEVFRGERGLFVVNEQPLEEYVRGVVKVEVGEDWPIEALKAQAVAVRTYAVYNILRNKDGLFHVASSTLSQVYRGNQPDPDVEDAVNATRGEILTYDGKPINAMYHSTSGGITELPEEVFGRSYPYLRSVRTDCSTSPYYIWERRFSRNELEKAFGVDEILNIDVISLTRTGRASEVKIYGRRGSRVMKAQDIRKILGWKRLPSTWFTITVKDDLFIFRGRGYGHGVGMCQWSSMEMARKGMNYREILATFYPGTVIEIYEDR